MFKLIFGLIWSLKDWVQSLTGSAFENIRDEETGKLKGVRPRTVRKLIIILGLIFFFVVLVLKR